MLPQIDLSSEIGSPNNRPDFGMAEFPATDPVLAAWKKWAHGSC